PRSLWRGDERRWWEDDGDVDRSCDDDRGYGDDVVIPTCGCVVAVGASGARHEFGRSRGRGMVDTIWSEAQRQLRGALAGRDFEFWIAPLKPGRWEADELTLEVPSQFARDWSAREYLALIERAVGLASGRKARVRLTINRQLAHTLPERQAPQRTAALAQEERSDAGARFTFDTFVVGAS